MSLESAEPLTAAAPHRGLRLARLGLVAAMVSRLAGRLVGIVLVVVLARVADPSTMAVYGYLLGTATLVMILTDLGVAAIAGREVAAGRLTAPGALWAAIPIQFASVLAAGAVTVLFAGFWGPDNAPVASIALTVVFVVIGGMNNLWADMLRGSGRVVLEGALQLGATAALVVTGTLVVLAGGDATDLLIVVVLKEAVVLAICFGVLRPRRQSEVRPRDLLGQGMWVAVAGTAIVLLWREGTLVVGGLGSIGALATYVVATRFFDAGVTVAHTAGFGLGPGMAALADDPVAFRHTARKYLGLIGLLGVVVAVVGVLVAGPITTIPFGARWDVAVPAVRVVAVSGLPILLSYVCFTLLMARGQVRWLTWSSVAGTAVGVGATVVLVLLRPTALSGALGTAIGATTLTVLLFIGLRDLLLPPRAQSPGHEETAVTDGPSEEQLSAFYARYVESGAPAAAFLARHPLASVKALLQIGRLPRLHAELPPTAGGEAILGTVTRPGPFGTRVGRSGLAVLEVPAEPGRYSQGASRQTLRRKVRAAERAGVTWRPVDDPAERRRLLALANVAETEHADDRYRIDRPDNSDLLEHDLWLAAFAADGTPLLLSVTPTAAQWGQLRYFRTLGSSPVHSDTRYLMTQVLVEELCRRGVRYLVEGTHPAELPNGLRHFQRMVGYRLARVSAHPDSGPAHRRVAAGDPEREYHGLVAVGS